MVVVRRRGVLVPPLANDEQFKRCTRCRRLGVCSPDSARSGFYPVRSRGRYRPECAECSKALALAAYVPGPRRSSEASRLANEAFRTKHRERKRQQDRDSIARRKARDPEGFAASNAAACKRWRANEKAKAAGLVLLRPERREQVDKVAGGRGTAGGAVLAAAPFKAWLAAYRREVYFPHASLLARHLGLDERRVRAIQRDEYEGVRYDIVDRALTNARAEVTVGGRRIFTVEDLYNPTCGTCGHRAWTERCECAVPDWRYDWDGELEVVTVEEAARLADACATPGCTEPHNGGRFCHGHTEALARVREEFQADGLVMTANGGAPRHNSKRKRSNGPVCCNPDCWAPRAPGERFCLDCRVAGWVEDDDGIWLEETAV